MRKMRLRRYLLGILTISAVIIISYLNFYRIALFTISKLYSLEISYEGMTGDPKSGFVFENVRVLNKKIGVGFFSQRATIKPIWGVNMLKSVTLDFEFKDVHFLKNKIGVNKASYNTLSQLVAMPFEGRWMYKDVSGVVEIFSNGMTVKSFSANGREIRLMVFGDLYYNNTAYVDVTIYFSKEVLAEIPPELHSVILQDEPDEWKSFSVKMNGNLSSPSVQISGKLFRLNIGSIVAND